MATTAHMNGARLAFVVRELPGKVKRDVCSIKKGEGIKTVEKEQPAGFMVYFPRGHAIRLATRTQLAHYQLDKKPRIINIDNVLSDPNSPLSRVMQAQTTEERAQGMLDMEKAVIRMATATTGPVILAEQVKEIA